MNNSREETIKISIVDDWDISGIVELYRHGGWWEEEWNPEDIRPLIKGSFIFAIAADSKNRAVGMGRVISDGCSDGYIQDLVVHKEYRGSGLGRRLLNTLLLESKDRGLGWVGLIAEPGTSGFYEKEGFTIMADHIPMVIRFDND